MPHTASLLVAAGRVEIGRAEMPHAIQSGWVRLRLATASLCGTDMHYFRHFANAGFELERPITLGHEACAHVLDPNGSALEAGALVAISPVIECGTCERCASGDINMCADKRFPGSATTRPHIDGFFRQRFDFPARCCTPIAAAIEPDHLTFAEPLACALHAVNRAGVEPGMRVLVTGCGPMGLLAAVGAIARGAEVDVTDLKPDSIDAALAVGARTGYRSGGAPAVPADEYDVAIEASGSAHAYNQALAAVRKQGTVAVLSLIQPSPVPVHLHLATLKEVCSVGSILYTREFGDALALIASGTVDFERLVAARFPVADTQAACELMASGGAVGKVLIVPGE